MKNNQSQINNKNTNNEMPNFYTPQPFNETQFQSLLNNNIALKCAQENQLNQFCFNSKCNCTKPNPSNPKKPNHFICQKSKCLTCSTSHVQCQRSSIQYILKCIKSKICSTEPIKSEIQQMFLKTINQLIKFKKIVFTEIDKKFKYMLLTEIQRDFVKVLAKQKQARQFDGGKLAKLRMIYSEKYLQSPPNIHLFINPLKGFHSRIKQQISQLQLKIFHTMSSISQLKVPQENKLLYFSLQSKSSILGSKQEQCKSLIEIFKDQKISGKFGIQKIHSIKLLYKASENGFHMKQYYQKCGKQTDTIIMCQTQKGKIIGGYTPLAFECTQKTANQYVNDLTGTSFLFNLTPSKSQNLKRGQHYKYDIFPIKSPTTQAIYHHSSKQFIQFGYGGQFALCDNANQNNQCFTDYINTSYYNENYANNIQGFKKLNGNQTNCFSVKQWEVWKIKWQNENQNK